MAARDLGGLVPGWGRPPPGGGVRGAEPVSIEEDVMALVLEYERRRRYPILFFDRITGHDMPMVCNVVASRPALAWALGADEQALAAEHAPRLKEHLNPVVVLTPPFRP